MRIDQFHDNIRSLANIGQSQYMPPEEIDLQINNAVKDMFSQEYKHFEATQEITDTLGFYKKKSDPAVVDGEGQAVIPADFYHLTGADAIMSDDSVVELDMLSDSHWPKRKFSGAYAPSAKYPIGRQIGALLTEVLPLAVAAVGETPAIIGVKSVVFYYLRRPADAKYGYVPNATETGWAYEQGSSVEVDWPEVGHSAIQDKAISSVGVILRDNTLIANDTVKSQQNERK